MGLISPGDLVNFKYFHLDRYDNNRVTFQLRVERYELMDVTGWSEW